jgi:hypothetical protein
MNVALALVLAVVSQSAAVRQAARELLRFVESRFAREVAEEGAERLEPRLVRAIEQWGDDAVAAIRTVGPRVGMRALESHGAPAARFLSRFGDDGARVLSEEGDTALRLWSRYGDEAVEAMVRHRGVGARIADELGTAGMRASRGLSEDGAVRLAGVAPLVRGSGRAAEILSVVERFGDRACAFLWRNKGVVFGAALLAAFLSDPEPYLAGVKELVVTPAKELGTEAAKRTDWTVVVVAGIVLTLMAMSLRMVLRSRVR